MLQHGLGPAPPFAPGYARERQGQLHVGQHRLVGDQVVALEHKAHGVVAVGVPVAVLEVLGGASANGEVAAGVLIQAADDVQKGGFPTAGMAQDGDEFVFTERDGQAPQGLHLVAALAVGLGDLVEF